MHGNIKVKMQHYSRFIRKLFEWDVLLRVWWVPKNWVPFFDWTVVFQYIIQTGMLFKTHSQSWNQRSVYVRLYVPVCVYHAASSFRPIEGGRLWPTCFIKYTPWKGNRGLRLQDVPFSNNELGASLNGKYTRLQWFLLVTFTWFSYFYSWAEFLFAWIFQVTAARR